MGVFTKIKAEISRRQAEARRRKFVAMRLVCWIFGHEWGESGLDQAIRKDWGLNTCQRCKLVDGKPYDNVYR